MSDDFSQAEAAYFSSKGTDTSGLVAEFALAPKQRPSFRVWTAGAWKISRRHSPRAQRRWTIGRIEGITPWGYSLRTKTFFWAIQPVKFQVHTWGCATRARKACDCGASR
jgi:hypothetical protein